MGAKELDILKLIVGRGLLLTSIRISLGTAIAFAISHLMSDFLCGVSPTDPITFLIIPSLLMAVALIASYALYQSSNFPNLIKLIVRLNLLLRIIIYEEN
ncbi:MAG: hypothetical protein HY819_17940 [Acidobacteria bacterium]|nr:hypothetical protein [Acidobacteriota bacterium]